MFQHPSDDPADSAATPDQIRRRRLHFRCWHRGMREMDLVLGRFADARLADLSDAELAELEVLLDIPDPELFAWISGLRPAQAGHDTALMHAIRAFHAAPPADPEGGGL